MESFKNPRKLAIAGLLIAIQIILTRTLSIQTPITRIGFSFIPTAVSAALLGPWMAGVAGAIADLVGITLFPNPQGYFFGFTISAFLTPFIYGLFFYKKKLNWKSIVPACITVTILVALVLNTIWVLMLTGKGFFVIIGTRLVSNLVLLAVKIPVLLAILPRIVREGEKYVKDKPKQVIPR